MIVVGEVESTSMAADHSNMGLGFHHGAAPASFYDHRMLSFQSSGGGPAAGTFSPAGAMNNFNDSRSAPVPLSGGGGLIDPAPRLRRDTGLAADWTFNEQVILREGLAKYANEPSILKYIKIATLLREKTVRDVALRCRWITKKEHGKRRKPEEHYVGKKLKDRKEKMVDSYLENIHMLNSDVASYSHMTPHVNHIDQISCEAPALDGPVWNLMGENAQVFRQIEANLATLKIQDNIDLFCLTRNNIAAILNSMSEMPGIMNHMPPLRVSVDEQLLSTILPGTGQALMFGSPGSVRLKQEL